MTNKRIQELADFFYSSNNSNVVPLRIAIITGRYSGLNLNRKNFTKLISILNNSDHLKEDLLEFLENIENEE